MMRGPIIKSFAAILVIVLVAPAAFFSYAPPAHAALATFGEQVLQLVEEAATNISTAASAISNEITATETTISAIKDTASYILDITNTAANYARYIKTYVLDPIAFIMGGNLLKSITSSILGFVNKNKLYVQNLPGYMQNVGDVQAYAFLNQFSSTSNSPFAAAITSSLRANYLQQTTMAGFFAANRNTLNKSSPNIKSFLAGNWGQGGATAWFALTTQDQNNPYMLYYRTQDQMTRSVQSMTAAKLAQLNWGQGLLSWCGSGVNTSSSSGADADGTYGCKDLDEDGVCLDKTSTDTTTSDTSTTVTCSGGTVAAGGVCGCQNLNGCGTDSAGNEIKDNTYVLPTGYSCSGGASFDSTYGACQASGLYSAPVDALGTPLSYPSDENGDTPSTTTTAPAGTAKFSTGKFDLTATTNLTKLDAILTDASKVLPEGYKVVVTSAERSGSGGSAHDIGSAVDIQIFDSKGVKLPNSGDASATGYYKDLAVAAYNSQQTLYPELGTKTLRWGGCFDTKAGSGKKDGMHYDLAGGTRAQGKYCSSGLSGIAAGGTVSLGPQGPTKVAVVPLPTSSAGKSSSVVGNALGYVWNLAPTATAETQSLSDYLNSSEGKTASDALSSSGGSATLSTDLTTGKTSTVGTGSSITKIPQPGDSCTKKDGTQGTIQTPGSVIKGFLTDVLGLNVQKVTMIGDIGASINGILGNVATILKTVDMAAGLFGASGGLASVGGTSSYNSPFNSYLNSSTYMGLSTSDIKTTSTDVPAPGKATDTTGTTHAVATTTATTVEGTATPAATDTSTTPANTAAPGTDTTTSSNSGGE